MNDLVTLALGAACWLAAWGLARGCARLQGGRRP